MHALILNGSRGDDALDDIQDDIAGALAARGWQPRVFRLRDKDLVFCAGCSQCWIETPGTCKVDVAGQAIARAALASELMIWLTPVTFGGYSYELKKALDRLIGSLLPTPPSRREEVSPARPALLALGLAGRPAPEHARVFDNLVRRKAALFRVPRVEVGLLEPERPQAWGPLLQSMLAGLAAPAPHAVRV